MNKMTPFNHHYCIKCPSRFHACPCHKLTYEFFKKNKDLFFDNAVAIIDENATNIFGCKIIKKNPHYNGYRDNRKYHFDISPSVIKKGILWPQQLPPELAKIDSRTRYNMFANNTWPYQEDW